MHWSFFQADLVQQVRKFGLGEGGFYTPTYASGGQMHLQMFCMGQHWEVRTHSYEHTRSAYDGATPPPIPSVLCALTDVSKNDQRCVIPVLS